jgi:type II secretory pathway pseudopilin PulG
MKKVRSRQRGVTLLEIMFSMAVVLTGMVGLFKVLGSSIRGSQTAQRFTQGQARAEQIEEAIRAAPKTVLDCLVGTPVAGWTACEAQCQATLGVNALAQSCVFVTLNNAPGLNGAGLGSDSTQQAYLVVDNGNNDARSTWVRTTGRSNRVYDAQITVGWNDDGTATLPVDHAVTMHSAVFQ